MVFKVETTETLSRIVEVDCNSPSEAENVVRHKWKRGEIILGADDFAGVAFSPIADGHLKITPRMSTD